MKAYDVYNDYFFFLGCMGNLLLMCDFLGEKGVIAPKTAVRHSMYVFESRRLRAWHKKWFKRVISWANVVFFVTMSFLKTTCRQLHST